MMITKEITIADQTLTIHQIDDIYDSATGRPLTGAWIWNSAPILSHYLTTTNFNFHSKSVIEIGAGAGLPGLTAARLGASRVILTDVAALLPGLQKNAEANGVSDKVEVREVVWGREKEDDMSLEEFDVVLMSDLFYDREEMEGLGRTLRRVSGRRSVVLAASEVRWWTEECVSELERMGFGIVAVEEVSGGGGDGELYAVYRILPPTDKDQCCVGGEAVVR